MKAFAVLEDCENTGGIIFAKHDIVARRQGAEEWAEGDLSSVTCRRAPWADGYAGRPIPARVMIANGWHFECTCCGTRIDEEWLLDNRLPIEGVIGTQHTQVFCSKKCAKRHYRLEYRRRDQERKAIEHFKARVLRRLPEAEICEDHEREHHAFVKPGRGGWVWHQVIVGFRYPGMRYGPAHLRFDSASVYGGRKENGPPAPRYMVAGGDREIFLEWAKAGDDT